MAAQLLCDRALAQRLERAEAAANAQFVEARARVEPDSGAGWIEVADAHAMYDGPRSPCTQTFGLGLFRMPTEGDMDTLERFFTSRGAPVLHEVSPLADKAVLGLLNGRGYRPLELTSVMFKPIAPAPAPETAAVRARLIRDDERELWARTAAAGWRELVDFSDLMGDLMRVLSAREDALSFLAKIDGEPVAAGSLFIRDGVALLAGASTIPEWRHRGAQHALLGARLRHAADAGCDLAMMCAEPGSASQRNAERQGFRIAYTRIKWELAGASGTT